MFYTILERCATNPLIYQNRPNLTQPGELGHFLGVNGLGRFLVVDRLPKFWLQRVRLGVDQQIHKSTQPNLTRLYIKYIHILYGLLTFLPLFLNKK